MKQHLYNATMAALFLTGIALAGSDGDYFPSINFAGVALFGLFALLARRIES